MKRIWIAALAAAALMSLGSEGHAFTRHPSTPTERAQTKTLNDQQLALAKQENVGLAINASSVATDASQNLAANSSPAAAPTLPVATEAEATSPGP